MHQANLDHYTETTVHTVTRERLVVMLYDGAIRFVRRAREAVERGDIGERGMMINRASRIVQELNNALEPADDDGAIARQLASLYSFAERELALANLENNARRLDGVLQVLEPLAESWREIADGAASNSGGTELAQRPAESNALSLTV